MEWLIAAWSTPLARGTVRSSAGAELAFDASVATVGSFVVGERVVVEHEGARVLRVAPVRAAAAPPPMEPAWRVAPEGLLALRLDAAARARLEDLAFEELDLLTIVDTETGYVTDHGPAWRALLARELGREIDELVAIEGKIPFDWSGRGHLDALLERLAPTLPGFRADAATFFFRGDDRASAGLWWSIETIGLHVGGVLPRADFEAWRSALAARTSAWPMRRA